MTTLRTPVRGTAESALPKPYYQDEAVTIYHGDCREILPGLTRVGVDLIFTSPPYNLGVSSGGGFPGIGHYAPVVGLADRGGHGKWPRATLANGYEGHDDGMPPAEYVEWQRQILRLCWGTLSSFGAIFYNHKPRVQRGECWLPLECNPGLPLRQIIVWARAGGINFAPTHYVPTYEWIMVAQDDRGSSPAICATDRSAVGRFNGSSRQGKRK